MKLTRRELTAAALLTSALPAVPAWAQRGETVRIALIDPQTGIMGPVGINQLRTFRFFAEKFSGAGNPAGVRFEIEDFDNKLSASESLTGVQAAIGRGTRFITQGSGSGIAGAIITAVERHNRRNPGQEVVFLNHSAVDPDLTGSRCSFWHFRFCGNTAMKMQALTTHIRGEPTIRRVFLINQNYTHGHQVARYARQMLARKRPDIQIVGESLHPLALVRDFTPYVANIMASGADSVITGNWGSDLSLLIRAANDAGYTGRFFTYYAGVTGTPTALGTASEGRVYQIAINHHNMGGQMQIWMNEFRQRFNDDLILGSAIHIFNALGVAMQNARSTNAARVAHAMSGLRFNSFSGPVEMRRADHELQQPLYLTRWQRVDAQHPYSPENTGMTLAVVRRFDADVASTPTTCAMQRPAAPV